MSYSHFHLSNFENLKALAEESERTARMLYASPNPQKDESDPNGLNRLAPTSISFDYEAPLGQLFTDAELDLLHGDDHHMVLRHFADFKRELRQGSFSRNTDWFDPKRHFDLVDIAKAHLESDQAEIYSIQDLFDEFCTYDWRPVPETRNELIRFVCDLLMRFHTLTGETLFNTSQELIEQVAGCSEKDDGYTMRIVQLLLSTLDDKEKMPDWIANFAESAPSLVEQPSTLHRPLSKDD